MNRIRRWVITLLGLGLLLVYGAGLVQLIQNWGYLPGLSLSVSRSYLVLSRGALAMLGAVLLLGRLTRSRWVLPLTCWGTTGYVVWFWLDRAFASAQPLTGGNFVFWLASSVLLLGLAWWTGSKDPFILRLPTSED